MMHKFRGAGAVAQSFRMSVKNILGNKMRSFLTTLGIIIGVMSVIALVTIVEGVTDEMMGRFTSMGTGVLSITASGTAYQQGLSESDLAGLAELENVRGVTPGISLTTSAVRNGVITESVSVSGRRGDYFKCNDVMDYGRPLYSSDMGGDVYVCVVDSDFVKNVFIGETPIDKEIILGGNTYRIVGVTSDDSGGIMSDMSQGTDGGSVIIPYRNAMRMSGRNLVQSVSVYVDDVDRSSETQSAVEDYLLGIFNNDEDSFWIMSLDSMLDMMDTVMSLMTGVLTGIASISLLVGGIGIMNMMLVSVTERTKEIGLRKALGATPGRIQAQFLIEAVILSLAGGLIGLVLGLLISVIAAAAMGITFTLSVFAIELGVGFSAAVGVIFGWVPAKKASELNPIDALRSE